MSMWTRPLPGLLVGVAFAALLGGTVWVLTREKKPAAAPTPSAATVAKPVKEGDLATIVLTEAAENSLDVQTGPVERRKVERRRTYGGDVQVPAGRTLLVAVPLTGRLRAPEGGVPAPGKAVKKGQPVFLLVPLLTPEARTTLATTLVEAEGQVKNATVQVDAATIALNRAKKLLAEEAGSRRAVDEAQAVFDLAQKTLEAAQGRRDLIARALREGEADGLPPLPLVAPYDGLLRNVNASPGQNVPAGAALFELIDAAVLWVRVPVFAGELSEIDADRTATVGELVPRPGSPRRQARPMEAPPSADPLSTTVDQFYRVDNRDGVFRPGQRVGVSLALAGSDEGLVVPCQAIIYDIHGNGWVYVRTAARTYVRQRVLVREVVGELALLSEGPPEKAHVVTGGAAELFGTEMGFAK